MLINLRIWLQNEMSSIHDTVHYSIYRAEHLTHFKSHSQFYSSRSTSSSWRRSSLAITNTTIFTHLRSSEYWRGYEDKITLFLIIPINNSSQPELLVLWHIRVQLYNRVSKSSWFKTVSFTWSEHLLHYSNHTVDIIRLGYEKITIDKQD